MKRVLVLVVAIAGLVLPACSGSSSGGSTRTVLGDFNYDQFATSIMGYFPRVTEVHPGDKVVFKQAWTGEAHTVTFGTLVKPLSDIMTPYLTGAKPVPEQEPPGLEDASNKLPSLFGEKDANQTAAQPCFLASGALPPDGKACPRLAQPDFKGTEPFYSSGFIPYEGNNGNKFQMTLASSIKPGDYYFYCLLHGPAMGGVLRVKPSSDKVPSQSAVNATARQQLDQPLKQLTKLHRNALAKKWDLPPNTPHIDVLAGVTTPDSALTFGLTDEFYPKTFTAKVGQKVTWLLFGHTVSFKVPKYGPQLTVDPKTHAVHLNQQAYNPVGVNIPEFGDPNAPTPPFDAGTYDGSKFLSSGVQFGMAFSLTFTKPGTYPYACTIHPRMVGTLVVK